MGRVLSKELVEAARAGDKAALRALVEATQSRLFRFCVTLCGDPVRAEDLAQDAYLKTFDNLAKLDKSEAFIDWLFSMTKNLYIDQTRATREQATEEMEDVAAAGDFTEQLNVHRTLSQFDPEDRWLLLLVDMERYSYKEAGELLGISEDAVRSRVFRLRKEFLEKWQGR